MAVKNKALLSQIFERAEKFKLQRVQVTTFRAGPDKAWKASIHWMDNNGEKPFSMSHESDDVLDLVDALDGIYDRDNLANELNIIKEQEAVMDEPIDENLEEIDDEDLL